MPANSQPWLVQGSLALATLAMWTVKSRDYYQAFLPRGVDARCPLTLSPGWCREAWRWRRWR
ncbi:hypothetical protein C3E93_28525, partial [Klebsiella pneumoniae]